MGDANQVSTQPVMRSTFFDGTNLSAAFTPSLASTAGYTVSLFSGIVRQSQQTVSDPTLSWIELPGVAFPGLMSLNLDTLGNGGTPGAPTLKVSFPSSTLSIAPSDVLRLADGSILAQWTALQIGAQTNPLIGYQLMVRDTNSNAVVTADVNGITSVQGSLVMPAPVAIGNALEFRLIALNASQAGIASLPWRLIGAAPTNVRVAVGSSSLDVWWTPSLDASAAQHIPRLYSLQKGWFAYVNGSSDRAGHGSIPFDPTSTDSWIVVVLAAAAGAVPAASEACSVPAATVTLQQITAVAGGIVLSAATADDDPLGTPVLWRVLAGNVELGRALGVGGPTQINVDPAAVTSVAYRSVNDGSVAGEQQIAVSLSAPALPLIVTTATAGASSLVWTAVDAASGYLVDLGLGDPAKLVAASPTQFSLPSGTQSSAALAPRVAAQFLQSGASIIGLYSLAAVALPAAPAVVDSEYDGLSATVSWSDAGAADAFVVTAFDPGSGVIGATQRLPGSARETSLDLPLGNTGQDWQLVVQSIYASVAGVPSDAQSLITAGWYLAAPAAGAAVASAACIPLDGARQLQSFSTGQGVDLAWLLPPLAASALTSYPTCASFCIDSNSDTAFPYLLKIDASSSLWTFDGSSIRSSLRTDLVQFLKDLESAGAEPWALLLVQSIIARGAPLTFQESLYVEYGLTGPAVEIEQPFGSFDLRPGMILRIATANYVSLDPDVSGDLLNGFVAGSSIDFDITCESIGESWRPLADTFIGQLVALGATSVAAPESGSGGNSQSGIADAGDLLYPTLATSFLRVIVPDAILTTTSGGSAQASEQFSIAGANSYLALCELTSPPATGTRYAFFGGRTLLKACIRVQVNGVSETVSIGTTLADVLAAHAAAPAPAASALAGIELRRRTGARVQSSDVAMNPAESQPVFVNWRGLQVWDSATALSVPLLSGDEIWF